ncbi:preprotein translocase subunit SecG [Luteolibacter flavescens]|uniref:Protein-export membrane protein SecG n=1 Tax=Luteolibacter flavescens TaxID=1859460 RepID=A0ABT3FTX7_9BACT|nr:preprotein translocase subunit SecG [Luteolibacter flavescens]MCW1887041.1 preprotein translocase subunit SecG [Luteolibacter flavescens]
MTVLATWLDISINLLLFVFVIVCLLMSMIILMQRPKNEGLGAAFGSGTTDQLFGARTTNVLQKGTVYLSTLFFVLTLTLAVLMNKRTASQHTLQAEVPAAQVEEKPLSISEEAANAGEVQPEPVTPPAPVPAETTPAAPEETPAPTPEPTPETTPAEEPKPEAEPTPPSDATPPAEVTEPTEDAPKVEEP